MTWYRTKRSCRIDGVAHARGYVFEAEHFPVGCTREDVIACHPPESEPAKADGHYVDRMMRAGRAGRASRPTDEIDALISDLDISDTTDPDDLDGPFEE